MTELSWATIENDLKKLSSIKLTEDELFKLWQVFHKIGVNEEEAQIDIEEAAILIEDFMLAIGIPFVKGPLYCITTGYKITFLEFAECFQERYVFNTPQSIYVDGLNAINKKYLKEIVKEGILTKRGQTIRSLKERHFILTPRLLTYHENNKEKTKKGEIHINEQSEVYEALDKTRKCQFCVVCGSSQRVFEIAAPTPKIMNEWIAAIQKCISAVGGPTPLMRELLRRYNERTAKRKRENDDEILRRQQEALIKKQTEDLERICLDRDAAQIQAQNESALLELERQKREELEALKALEKAQNEAALLEEERKWKEEIEALKAEKEAALLEEQRKRQEELDALKAITEAELTEKERIRKEELESLKAATEVAIMEKEQKRKEEIEALKATYEKLLEEEKQAREAENEIRLRQEAILEEETTKRLELEKIKSLQEEYLEQERIAREGLEKLSKEQAEKLELEKSIMEELDQKRRLAEEEVSQLQSKIEAAQKERQEAAAKVELAKERARRIRAPVGLAKPIAVEHRTPSTHRGVGAFVEEDFTKTPLYLSSDLPPTPVNQSEIPSPEERAQIVTK